MDETVNVTIAGGEFIGDRGSLQTTTLFSALRTRTEAIRACANEARHGATPFVGRIGVELAISPRGRIASVRVTGVPGGHPLATCLQRQLTSVTLPAPGVAAVRYRTTVTIGAPPAQNSASTFQAPARAINPVAAPATRVDRTAFRRSVSAHREDWDACYERALRADPSLCGEVIIRFVIAPDGHVSEASVDQCAAGLEAVADCVVGRAGSWTFDPPGGTEPVITTYPFTFTSQ